MLELTDESFDDVVAGSDVPVLVDFTAEWCPPCHAIVPVLEEVASDLADVLLVTKLDVEQNPGVTARYHIMAMPTLVLFVGGEERRRIVGARGKARLLADLA